MNEEASTSPAPSTTESLHDLGDLLRHQSEWAKAVIFDEQCNILASTFEPITGELEAFLTAFDDRATTIGAGLTLGGDDYEVHRFFPNLIYGRRGDSNEGEGICLHRATCACTKKPIYGVITYVLPTISARAVPQLVEFFKTHVEPMQMSNE